MGRGKRKEEQKGSKEGREAYLAINRERAVVLNVREGRGEKG